MVSWRATTISWAVRFRVTGTDVELSEPSCTCRVQPHVHTSFISLVNDSKQNIFIFDRKYIFLLLSLSVCWDTQKWSKPSPDYIAWMLRRSSYSGFRIPFLLFIYFATHQPSNGTDNLSLQKSVEKFFFVSLNKHCWQNIPVSFSITEMKCEKKNVIYVLGELHYWFFWPISKYS